MDKKPIKWKIRRGVDRSPLLPPFMWLRSRPRQELPRVPADFPTTNDDITSNENGPTLVGMLAETVGLHFDTRPSVDSIAKASALSEESEGKNLIGSSKSILTEGSGVFEPGNDEIRMDDGTDPLVSHVLSRSYGHTPPARYYKVDATKARYKPVVLKKRPWSPIRHVLADKFDLVASRQRIMELSQKFAATEAFEGSRPRVCGFAMQCPHENGFGLSSSNFPMNLSITHDQVTLKRACESLGIAIEDIN